MEFTTNGSSKQAIDISISKVVAQLSCKLISKAKQNISPNESLTAFSKGYSPILLLDMEVYLDYMKV